MMVWRFLKQSWISILVYGAILVLCMIDSTDLPAEPMSDFDKLVHLLMFGVVSGVAFFENSHYFRCFVPYIRLLMGSLVFPIIFGGMIELLQEYCSASRSGDWMDFLFDVVGIGMGYLLCVFINKKLKRAI